VCVCNCFSHLFGANKTKQNKALIKGKLHQCGWKLFCSALKKVVRGSLENSVPCQLKRHTNFKVPVDFRGLSVYQLKFIDLCPRKCFKDEIPCGCHTCAAIIASRIRLLSFYLPFFLTTNILRGESYTIHTIFEMHS